MTTTLPDIPTAPPDGVAALLAAVSAMMAGADDDSGSGSDPCVRLQREMPPPDRGWWVDGDPSRFPDSNRRPEWAGAEEEWRQLDEVGTRLDVAGWTARAGDESVTRRIVGILERVQLDEMLATPNDLVPASFGAASFRAATAAAGIVACSAVVLRETATVADPRFVRSLRHWFEQIARRDLYPGDHVVIAVLFRFLQRWSAHVNAARRRVAESVDDLGRNRARLEEEGRGIWWFRRWGRHWREHRAAVARATTDCEAGEARLSTLVQIDEFVVAQRGDWYRLSPFCALDDGFRVDASPWTEPHWQVEPEPEFDDPDDLALEVEPASAPVATTEAGSPHLLDSLFDPGNRCSGLTRGLARGLGERLPIPGENERIPLGIGTVVEHLPALEPDLARSPNVAPWLCVLRMFRTWAQRVPGEVPREGRADLSDEARRPFGRLFTTWRDLSSLVEQIRNSGQPPRESDVDLRLTLLREFEALDVENSDGTGRLSRQVARLLAYWRNEIVVDVVTREVPVQPVTAEA